MFPLSPSKNEGFCFDHVGVEAHKGLSNEACNSDE